MSKYSIIFTKGNDEITIQTCDTLEEAKETIKEIDKEAQYHSGVLTIEKDGRIY